MKKYTINGARDIKEINNDPFLFAVIVEGEESMQVSDGYHTMDELYDHRISTYIALAKFQALFIKVTMRADVKPRNEVWRSKRHSDGEICFGTGTQFVLGIGKHKGEQITYHVPIERWDETDFAETLDIAPEWDEHTSSDVLERLKLL